MTTLQSVVRRRRVVAAAGAVSAGLLVLSACDKPTPVATITVGRDSVHSEALCYNDGNKLNAKSLAECVKNSGNVESIKVDQDESVRFGVDPKIADSGWTILVNGRQFTDSSKKTYRTIPGSAFFNAQYGTQGDTNTVTIQMDETKGLWSFKLKKA
ncbi:DUF2771 domain-containing protein [Streptomyces pluripotens]|uniref:DUF2771 domain-containing protein n=1 Tax=Streptomyces pluripotens TaxID=1355015 RepID=A0A221P113_9ACTN|nr:MULTISPECIES: hypothetical protein [Streptomyces]ARP71590.1 DUF2771 domain-containing protein [Streptomyces pluripotens]ASN25842.1 DUF2771 domain-containing protein [Streptomyces pluripotens]KIE27485.1 lipoprotein [Streptomyces sp. MUSC 125]MCH0557515.1 DUF2771 domain-containing protein [Streptomyces sp. MUM 16J]